MRVFIDTSYYLSFVDKPTEELGSFNEFKKLVPEKVELIFPQVTQEEFIRKLSKVVITFIDLPKNPPMNVSYANVDQETREKIEKLHKEYRKELTKLKSHYSKSIEEYGNRLLGDYRELARKTPETSALIKSAHNRKLKGNPPGKKNHIGDELAWETILKYCSDDDISIISKDPDWKDERDKNNFKVHPFLEYEWKNKTKKNVILYNSLGKFINDFTGEKRIPEKEIKSEKQSGTPLTYRGDQDSGPIFFTSPYLGVVSPISTPSIDQWQPITVVGGDERIQCYSCGRWINRNDYYGFTPKGFGCKFCAET